MDTVPALTNMIGAWLLAAVCVAAMGFAIQRGGTCTVAAVDEVLSQRRARRLAAMLEASFWVSGGLALAQLLGVAGSMPPSFEIDSWTVVGGALLGLGAWLNGACVFGAIARLGSGEWAYVLTPLGFYAGCASVTLLFAHAGATQQMRVSPLLQAASAFGPLFLAYAAWRVVPPLTALLGAAHLPRLRRLRTAVWAPHAATIVIGVTFVITLLAVGRWAYTDLLAELANGTATGVADNLGLRSALFGALLAGAVFGGWSAGRWASVPITATQLIRCFSGGVLMGWGSLLIPGSNDGLILVGIPLLQPQAWLASRPWA